MKNSLKEKAIISFRSGLNCAQSVVTAYDNKLGFDKDLALSISCGFGGGMGRLQETCGAVTGAYMILGIDRCRKFTDNSARKENTYALVQKFAEKFTNLNGATDCRSLIKCDIRSDEGHRLAKENNLFGTVCEKCISDSVDIIEELIADQ